LSRRQKAGGKRQEAKGRRQKAGVRRQKAKGKRQEAGGKRQEAKGRRQKAGGRRLFLFILPLQRAQSGLPTSLITADCLLITAH